MGKNKSKNKKQADKAAQKGLAVERTDQNTELIQPSMPTQVEASEPANNTQPGLAPSVKSNASTHAEASKPAQNTQRGSTASTKSNVPTHVEASRPVQNTQPGSTASIKSNKPTEVEASKPAQNTQPGQSVSKRKLPRKTVRYQPLITRFFRHLVPSNGLPSNQRQITDYFRAASSAIPAHESTTSPEKIAKSSTHDDQGAKEGVAKSKESSSQDAPESQTLSDPLMHVTNKVISREDAQAIEKKAKAVATSQAGGSIYNTAEAIATILEICAPNMSAEEKSKVNMDQAQGIIAEFAKSSTLPEIHSAGETFEKQMREVAGSATTSDEKKKGKRKAKKSAGKNESEGKKEVEIRAAGSTTKTDLDVEAAERCTRDMCAASMTSAAAHVASLDAKTMQTDFMEYRGTIKRVLEPHILYLVQGGIVQIWNGLILELSRAKPKVFAVTSTNLIMGTGQDVFEWLEAVNPRATSEAIDARALKLIETLEKQTLETIPEEARGDAWNMLIDYMTLWAFGGTYPDLGYFAIEGMARVVSEARAHDQVQDLIQKRILFATYRHPTMFSEKTKKEMLSLGLCTVRKWDPDGYESKFAPRPEEEKPPCTTPACDVIVASSIALALGCRCQIALSKCCSSTSIPPSPPITPPPPFLEITISSSPQDACLCLL